MRSVLMVGLVSVLVAASVAAEPPAAWVTVSGQVVLPSGVSVPELKGIAGAPPGVSDESVSVNPKNRGVKNVVVWLRPDDKDSKAVFPPRQLNPADARRKPQDVVIDQPGNLFEPRVLTARVGDTVVVKNSSKVTRCFQWDSQQNGQVNQIIPPKEMFRFTTPLVAERTPCEYKSVIEPWMVGYVRVFDHPYFAVTDADGKFEIKDAPSGTFRLVVWHEKVGYLGGRDGRLGGPVKLTPGKDGWMKLDQIAFDVTK